MELFFLMLAVGVIGLLSGALTYVLEYIIGQPYKDNLNTRAVFSRYGLWVRRKYNEYEFRLSERVIRQKDVLSEENVEVKSINIYMMLGACPSCFNIWVTAAFSIITLLSIGYSPFWAFLALGTSHFSLHFMMDNLD